ncbi:hypothetical protein [Aeromonas hydrophila]|uniref:hypothetical protein n=1 Tax=Aeromonas hydrophila TaxID=644 RepID=UPI003672BA26
MTILNIIMAQFAIAAVTYLIWVCIPRTSNIKKYAITQAEQRFKDTYIVKYARWLPSQPMCDIAVVCAELELDKKRLQDELNELKKENK